jgi:hypothetical protein
VLSKGSLGCSSSRARGFGLLPKEGQELSLLVVSSPLRGGAGRGAGRGVASVGLLCNGLVVTGGDRQRLLGKGPKILTALKDAHGLGVLLGLLLLMMVLRRGT